MQCPPTPGPGLKILTRGMAVGQADRFPNVHTEFIGQAGKFVGDGDVDITIRILHQLDHFRCGRISLDDLAFDENRIEVSARLGGFGGHAADHARVLDQLTQDLAGQDSLG